MTSISPCPKCGGGNLYMANKEVSSGGGYAPDYLPGLGGLLRKAKFQVVVCADCGLTQLLALSSARSELTESAKWERVY